MSNPADRGCATHGLVNCTKCGAGALLVEAEKAITALQDRVDALTAQKDGAYRERDLCVALIAKLASAVRQDDVWMAEHDPADATWDPEWRNIVFVLLPTGQVSWHIHDSEVPLFRFVRRVRDPLPPPWDGHTTEEKYQRIRDALGLRSVEFTP